MQQRSRFRGSLRARLAPPALVAVLMTGSLFAAGSAGAPPRPMGSGVEEITPAEGKALADWALARPEVAAQFKGHRTRLLRAGLVESAKGSRAARSASKAVLLFRDYDAGVARQVIVDLETGQTEVFRAGLVQPSLEEQSEAKSIVLRDPGLAPFAADPSLVLLGGFHTKSPHTDDPCSRDVCLEFAFMRPGPSATKLAEAEKRPPRRVIVNLSRGAVVNRDYRASADPSSPLPRMTAGEVQR